jgi:hypothetical protein
MHKLLFTDLRNGACVVPVMPLSGTRTKFPKDPFVDFGPADLKQVRNLPKKDDNTWTFAIAVEIGTDGSMYYQAFKIDWDEVKKNIEGGMASAATDLLIRELPQAELSLDPRKYQNVPMVKIRNEVAKLGVGSDTVATEALCVRLMYLYLRNMKRTDEDAITEIVKMLKKGGPQKYELKYECPAYNPGRVQVLSRVKD